VIKSYNQYKKMLSNNISNKVVQGLVFVGTSVMRLLHTKQSLSFQEMITYKWYITKLIQLIIIGQTWALQNCWTTLNVTKKGINYDRWWLMTFPIVRITLIIESSVFSNFEKMKWHIYDVIWRHYSATEALHT
jgi:hypothetical protein